MSVSILAASMMLLANVPAVAEDARCKGGIRRAAARFGPAALPKVSAHDRYRAFVKACAQAEVIALTSTLIGFETVSSLPPEKKAPHFSAMAKFLGRWSRAHGLTFRTVGRDDVFEVRWGKGRPQLGLVFHGDVVPPDTTPLGAKKPFVAEIRDGRLHGRGAIDDKGPLAAALVAGAMAKAMGLQPEGEVRWMVGNGEESDWTPMRAYAESAPAFEHVVSVDASFPVMAGQSGFVTWELTAKASPADARAQASDAGATVGLMPVDVVAGEFLTQVPGEAVLTLQPVGMTLEAALARVRAAIAATQKTRPGLKAEASSADGRVVLSTRGQAVHSSSADQGHNALWELAAVAQALPLQPGGITEMLGVVARKFVDDHYGRKLGLFHEHDVMGKLLVAPTVLRASDEQVTLRVNMRRPAGRDAAAFGASLDEAAKAIASQTGGAVTEAKAARRVNDPHIADLSGPLVTTLLDIYQRYRPAEGTPKPRSMRGGTYARLFPRAVDFGPSFPGERYTGHSAQESISVESLHLVTQMLGEVLLRLAIDPALVSAPNTASQ